MKSRQQIADNLANTLKYYKSCLCEDGDNWGGTNEKARIERDRITPIYHSKALAASEWYFANSEINHLIEFVFLKEELGI